MGSMSLDMKTGWKELQNAKCDIALIHYGKGHIIIDSGPDANFLALMAETERRGVRDRANGVALCDC